MGLPRSAVIVMAFWISSPFIGCRASRKVCSRALTEVTTLDTPLGPLLCNCTHLIVSRRASQDTTAHDDRPVHNHHFHNEHKREATCKKVPKRLWSMPLRNGVTRSHLNLLEKPSKLAKYDGLDVDLRGAGNLNTAQINFIKLVKRKMPKKILSVTLDGKDLYDDNDINVLKVSRFVDFLNVPTSDCAPTDISLDNLKRKIGPSGMRWISGKRIFLKRDFYFYLTAGIPKRKLNLMANIWYSVCEYKVSEKVPDLPWVKRFDILHGEKDLQRWPAYLKGIISPIDFRRSMYRDWNWMIREDLETIRNKVCYAMHNLEYGGIFFPEVVVEEDVHRMEPDILNWFMAASDAFYDSKICNPDLLPPPSLYSRDDKDSDEANDDWGEDPNGGISQLDKDGNPVCPPGDFYFLALQENCTYYVACFWGDPVIMECPDKTSYDVDFEACTSAAYVRYNC